MLWFAFKLVSLNHWKQQKILFPVGIVVVICFQISIFEPLETTPLRFDTCSILLWFAFKLVSLNHWKQPYYQNHYYNKVVICFQISIFEPLETTIVKPEPCSVELWFAFKLVSLNHWKQQKILFPVGIVVVICFQISIFEPLETTPLRFDTCSILLWFAFKLVSLNHWKQPYYQNHYYNKVVICFQISIFEPLETTIVKPEPCSVELWFAFKLVSLNHWKQQTDRFHK